MIELRPFAPSSPAAHAPFLLGCSQPAFSGFATEAGQARPLLSTSELPGRLMNGGSDQAGRRSHPARSVRRSKQSGETTNPVAVRRCLPRPIAIRASWLRRSPALARPPHRRAITSCIQISSAFLGEKLVALLHQRMRRLRSRWSASRQSCG